MSVVNEQQTSSCFGQICLLCRITSRRITFNKQLFLYCDLASENKAKPKAAQGLQNIWPFNGGIIAWENRQWIFQWHLLFPREITSEDREQKFPADDRVVVLIGWKFASNNQKHYPDLGSDASSVWNFCACFSDVISRGNRWWRRGMLAVFSG